MGVVLAEGVSLVGRFRLEACIGEGGMGVVWAATNTNTLRRVALKFLKPEDASDPKVRRRFLREARAASAVRHPNVVEILDVLELEDGSPAMVMELLEGESLAQRFKRDGRFDVGVLASIMLPAIAAVGAAHALGIVHRDLKPDNIFLSKAPDGSSVVKVLDFGIAKVSALDEEAGQTADLTGTGAMLGTPYYMSPEQVFADAVIDYRSDIWALGVILYQCLAGTRPTQADSVGQIMKIIMTGAIVPLEKLRSDLPPDLTALVNGMLSSDREARPQSLKDVCDVLRGHSDVTFTTFGDPVFVNVVTQNASSGELKRAEIDSGEHTNEEPTRNLGPSEQRGNTGEVSASGSEKRQPEKREATLRTENHLGLSLSSERPAGLWRWPRWATVALVAGVALVAVPVLGRVLVPSATPTPPGSSVLPEPPPDKPAPKLSMSIAPLASSGPSATDVSGTDAGAVITHVDEVDAGRAIVKKPPPREPAVVAARPPVTTTTTTTTSAAPSSQPANGGLVEKPPF